MKSKTTGEDVFQLVQLSDFTDDRGSLACVESAKHVPFEVKRVFWIYHVPPGKTRGGHAHRTCHEAVFPVCGALDIELSDGCRSCTYHLDQPTQGIVIPAGVWCELRNIEPGTVCVAMASQEYDTEGYLNDYNEFLAWRQEANSKEV